MQGSTLNAMANAVQLRKQPIAAATVGLTTRSIRIGEERDTLGWAASSPAEQLYIQRQLPAATTAS